MIQRQQTLWLLLATIAAVLTYFFPFLIGYKVYTPTTAAEDLTAGSNFFTLILTGVSIIISTITIFQFKDRKLQIKLSLLGILVSIIILVIYIVEMQKLQKTTLALYCVLPILVIVSYFMAFRNIRKDERLVKSLDKLR